MLGSIHIFARFNAGEQVVALLDIHAANSRHERLFTVHLDPVFGMQLKHHP